MQPATVKRCHHQAFRWFWRGKSRPVAGRPPLAEDLRTVIRRLNRENPLWSAERIRDTLRLLNYPSPCADTIRKYMRQPRHPRRKSTTWLPFLHNHLQVSWTIDFFTVVTAKFSVLYVFLVLDHRRRQVVHWASTYHPTLAWVVQQLREATPFGHQPQYLFRDNDQIYGTGVQEFLERCGIKEVRIAYRSPWQNPYMERFVGTLRRELLDHVIILSQGHLDQLLRDFLDGYYHVARPHKGLAGDTPLASPKPQDTAAASKLVAFAVCGGLHHRYERLAA